MFCRRLLKVLLGASVIPAVAFAQAAPIVTPSPAVDDDIEVPASPNPAANAAPQPEVPNPSGVPTGPPAPQEPVVDGVPRVQQPAATSALAPRGDTANPDSDPVAQLESSPHHRPVPVGFKLSGYLQTQYESSQLSEDQLQQGGVPYNRDRFVLRRARIRADRGWEYAAAALELDGSYLQRASFSVRRAEASLLYRGVGSGNLYPLVMLTLGVFETPFGYELMDSSRSRWFMERSTGSLALFPTEPDIGARVSGSLGPFRYSVAVVNGEPLDDRSGRSLGDPNAAKDVVGRIGADVQPIDRLRISGGVSFLHGKGFHAGAGATKDTAVWVDSNENGQVEQGEVNGVSGRASVPSQSYRRWAVGSDLQLQWRTMLGWTTVYGEAFVASNLDRGLVVADPIATDLDATGSNRTGDVREIGGYVGVLQEVARYGIVGFRADVYDPNSDFLRQRQGKLLPATYRITTLSPLLGLVLPNQARLLFQYDIIRDHYGKDTRGVPADLKNDQWTLRLQVML